MQLRLQNVRTGRKLTCCSSGQVSTCPECEGVGETSTPCGTCGGDGRVRKSKRISLTVPAGGPSLPALVPLGQPCWAASAWLTLHCQLLLAGWPLPPFLFSRSMQGGLHRVVVPNMTH